MLPESAATPEPGYARPKSSVETIARILSAVFHPFLIAPLSVMIVMWIDLGSLAQALLWTGVCAVFVILPAFLFLRYNLQKGHYSDADVSIRQQRFGFYWFGTLSMVVCFGVIVWMDGPFSLIAGFLAGLAVILLAQLVNRYWTKISVHAGVAAAAASLMAFFCGPLAIILALAALLVGWSRVVLARHTPFQVVLGWAVAATGILVVFGTLQWVYG